MALRSIGVRRRVVGTAPLTIPNQPFTTSAAFALPGTYTPVPVNIGGSADCGATPVVPIGNGDVASIIVPSGYYDVHSTYVFSS